MAPNYAFERSGYASSLARVRARLIAWHGRALGALGLAAQRER